MQLAARLRVRLHWLILLTFATIGIPASAAEGAAPVITTSPQTQSTTAGQTVTLTVVATGAAPLSYQWWFNTNALPLSNSDQIVLANVNALFSGTYVAVVSNLFGVATSAPAVLTVIGPPVITQHPTDQAVYVGQTATFSVTAYSKSPVTYQWQYLGNNLPNATNQVLNVAQVTTDNAGAYTVQVSNGNGTVTSFAAQLVVLALPPPTIRLGVLTDTNRIRVPVLYMANGTETNLSFTAVWDPAVYTNPTFLPERNVALRASAARRVHPASLPDSAVVVLDESQTSVGRLGILIAWPPGTGMAPGENTLGQLAFDLVEGRQDLYSGLLGFSGQPVPARISPPFSGQTNIVLNGINPQMSYAGPAILNRQTGLLEQTVRFANPGRVLVENTRLTLRNLNTDLLTNVISLSNAQGFILPEFTPYVDWGAIAPTEIREGILQYYVTDRHTQPTPTFEMFATPQINFPVPQGDVIPATIRRVNDTVLVEFPTITFFRYYIQYADSLEKFESGEVETSLPYVRGTGSNLQWMDSGPPRTLPAADNGQLRYYRVLEVE
ncbi:MAG: immunoglobulin domain-containing protein [Verrucomicrobiota bacterium]